MKNFLSVTLTLFILLAIFMSSCSIESVDDHYATEATKATETSDVVNLKVDCSTALDKLPDSLKNSDFIPSDGIILETTVAIEEGDTCYTVLTKALNEKQIQFDASGEGDSVYVTGISHLYGGDCGDMSGWMVSLNGDFNSVSANSTELKPNDTVEWLYTCDMGADIGYVYEE